MRAAVESELTRKISIKGVQATAINYANKRYFIPFGWYANPLPSTASVGWAVFTDKNYNPYYFGGDYNVYTF